MASFKNLRPLVLAVSLGLGALGVLSCDTGSSSTGTPGLATGECISNQAQIEVYDTFMQSLCGCQEAPEIVTPPNSLICTVPAGTSVWFWFTNATLFHQIQSTAQPTFQTSSLYDPSSSNAIRTHVVKFSTSGNYEFDDAYNSAINGTIVVQ